MKFINKKHFENLSLSRYRAYLKLMPTIKNTNTRIITTLILTFAAMSFFGAFAINPTLTTITNLKRQLEDNQHVYDSLVEKNQNLSSLLGQYNSLSSELPIIFSAIPQTPSAPGAVGKIQTLAKDANISLQSVHVSEIQLTGRSRKPEGYSFVILIDAKGQFENLVKFSSSLTQTDRIISIESISMVKDESTDNLVINIRARSYFKE